MRVLGLDVGEKTIGVAVSDALGISAQGVLVIRRQSKEKDMAALLKVIEEYEAERIVIGLPKNMDGSSGPQAEKALAFAEMLKKRFGLPVEAYDERLSTVLAQKALIEGGASRAKRKTVIDMIAAQVILQGWLDRKSKPRLPEEKNIIEHHNNEV
jgi:putative Holliday junction resolvase